MSAISVVPGNPALTVTYDTSSHVSIIFQSLGSEWKRILPYCIFNASLMIILHVLLMNGIDLNISNMGHTFLNIVVTFLLVSRVNLSLGRYHMARTNLQTLMKSVRSLIQHMAVNSGADTSPEAKEWRHEMAVQSLLLLRTAMAVLDYPSTGVMVASLPELQRNNPELLRQLRLAELQTPSKNPDREVNLKVPIRVAYVVRKTIRSQEGRVTPTFHVNIERDMYAFLDQFCNAYYGLHQFITTPVPFPLIQMSSTLVLFYVFTVPFALLMADSGTTKSLISHTLIVIFLTFGFLGMEFVSMRMDDPFGNDKIDFDNMALAQFAFDEADFVIRGLDGPEWADKLRNKVQYNTNNGTNGLANESTFLLDA